MVRTTKEREVERVRKERGESVHEYVHAYELLMSSLIRQPSSAGPLSSYCMICAHKTHPKSL